MMVWVVFFNLCNHSGFKFKRQGTSKECPNKATKMLRGLGHGGCGSVLSSSKGQGKRKWCQVVSEEVSVGHEQKFVYCNVCQVLEEATQGSGGVPMAGGV